MAWWLDRPDFDPPTFPADPPYLGALAARLAVLEARIAETEESLASKQRHEELTPIEMVADNHTARGHLRRWMARLSVEIKDIPDPLSLDKQEILPYLRRVCCSRDAAQYLLPAFCLRGMLYHITMGAAASEAA